MMFERMPQKCHGLKENMQNLPQNSTLADSPLWEGQGEPWYPALGVCRDLGLLPAFTVFQAIMALEAQMSIGALPADDYASSAGPISETAGELSASPDLSVMLWSATRRPPD